MSSANHPPYDPEFRTRAVEWARPGVNRLAVGWDVGA
jgi:hypothetical protein